MKHLNFSCGCKFEVLQEEPLRLNTSLNVENIPLDCQRTWDFIGSQNLCGVFQLDSNFSQNIAHKFKPRNIDELSVVIAISRPGSSEGKYEGKTVLNRILDRRNKLEEITPIDENIMDILESTYQLPVFQEQTLKILRKLAGFTLEAAEVARKIVGKKQADKMPQLRKDFLSGCEKVGLVNNEKASQIFDIIEASERYQFCAAHSCAYAHTTYMTAYFKAHFPRAFFTSYLYYAKDKQKPREEIFDLVQNARIMDIDVLPPDFRLLNKDFTLHNKQIYFGLVDIKGIGESVIKQLEKEIVETEKEIGRKAGEWSWLDFLLFFAPHIKSPAVKGLICTGALSYFKTDRTRMYFEYERLGDLVDREIEFLQKKHIEEPSLTFTELLSCLISTPTGRKFGGCSSAKRLESVKGILEMLKNPPFVLEDSIIWLSGVEEELMGISLTCTQVDACNIEAANCTCRDFIKGYNRPGPILLACKIDRVKDITTKNKQRMAFLSVSDISGNIDSIVVFPNLFAEQGELCKEGNTIMLQGKRGDKDKNSFVVDKIWQL